LRDRLAKAVTWRPTAPLALGSSEVCPSVASAALGERSAVLAPLLPLRVVENATDDTWRNIRHELDWMHLVRADRLTGIPALTLAVVTRP
jgi:hypothetical protein